MYVAQCNSCMSVCMCAYIVCGCVLTCIVFSMVFGRQFDNSLCSQTLPTTRPSAQHNDQNVLHNCNKAPPRQSASSICLTARSHCLQDNQCVSTTNSKHNNIKIIINTYLKKKHIMSTTYFCS